MSRSRSEPGEIVAVVGQNGSGKSTLVKVLAGVYETDSGRSRCSAPRLMLGGRARARPPLRPPGPRPGRRTDDGREPGARAPARPRARSAPAQRRRRAPPRGRADPPLRAIRRHRADPGRDAVAAGARDRRDRPRARRLDASPTTCSSSTSRRPRSTATRSSGCSTRSGGSPPTAPACVFISHRLDEVLGLADRVVVLRDGLRGRRRAVSTASTTTALVELIAGARDGRARGRVERARRGRPVLAVERPDRRPRRAT